jgi:hypothetical protein
MQMQKVPLNGGYKGIERSLDALMSYINQSSETRIIAPSLRKKMYELETNFLTFLFGMTY